MKVKAYCGCFVGAPHWHGTEVYEPDECHWEGVVEADRWEWQEGCMSITCPVCGAELWQQDDHFELLSGTQNFPTVGEVAQWKEMLSGQVLPKSS